MRSRLLLASAVLAACAQPSDSPPEPPPPGPFVPAAPRPDEPPVAEAAERPERVRETISIEGTLEPITLRLAAFPDVPLPFSTYLPDGWGSGVVGSGEGTAVRFTSGEAGLTLFVPAHVTSGAGVTGIARAVAESHGTARVLTGAAGWAEGGFSFSGDVVGSVRVGRHAGTWFYVTEEYPVEQGDGFAPRARLVLDRLRWLDDGTGL